MTQLIGYLLMFGMIGGGILMGSPLAIFLDPNSVLIVLGIVTGGALASLPPSRIGHALRDSFSKKGLSPERAQESSGVFFRLSELAIAGGFLGTVIGLVQMLQNMDDPTAIGPAMAVALLTLFYGIMLSELVFRSAASDILDRASSAPASDSAPFRQNRVGIIVAPVFVLLLTFMTMLVAML